MKDLILYIIYIDVHTLVYFVSIGIRFTHINLYISRNLMKESAQNMPLGNMTSCSR